MKNILYAIFLSAFFIGCSDDEFIEGTSVGFYPTTVATALEEDGVANPITLQAIGEVNGEGQATIQLTNYEFIQTIPAHTNGQVKVDFNGSNEAFLTVEALDDDLPYDYQSVFTVVSVSGELDGIANSKFTFNVMDDDLVSFFSDGFEAGNLSKWETVNSGAGNVWSIGDFSGNTYADISNFNSSGVTEGWLISPEIDFSANENEVLTFESQARFGGDLSPLEVVILTNYTGDPTTASEQALIYNLDPHEGAGFGNFTTSGEVDLTQISGVGRLAFHYTASDANDGSGWSVDNVVVNFFDPDASDGIPNTDDAGGGGGSGDCPDPISAPTISLPFTDDFENCIAAGEFNIPSNWMEENIPSSKTDRGWACRDFGRSGWGIYASAFGGEAGFDDAWLISNGTFDLTSVSSTSLEFYVESAFAGTGGLTLYWSADYAGTGDPECGTWTEVTHATSQFPDAGSGEFVMVSTHLDGAIGNNIFLAFQYESDNDDSSSWIIDDLTFTAN